MDLEPRDGIRIRQIAAEDVHALLAIERLCFSTPWSEMSFLGEIRSKSSLALLAEHHGHIVGYVFVRLVADECHLHDLAVHPSWQRQGIARLLMQSVLREVEGTDKRFFFLEVRASNSAAISLYTSLGFRVYASRKSYYDNPREDASLMRLDFEGSRSGN